jgi:uncharacterized OB-fold protein
MTDAEPAPNRPQPATPYLKFRADGTPFLEGSRCRLCQQTFLGLREHCARCAGRDCLDAAALADRGTLYNYTIVHRSLAGVTVPFISAVVDLEGGGTVKGNLLGVAADPAQLRFDMPVRVVFRGAELASPAGAGFISHFFIPDDEEAP